MRMYARIRNEKRDRITLVGVKHNLSKYTTISSYIDTFFEKVNSGDYPFFDGSSMEMGLDKCIYTYLDIDDVEQKDVFNYIGDATNHDELVALIPEYFI